MSGADVLDELLRSGATFAAFREPGGAAQAYVQHSAALDLAQEGEPCFVLAPFETEGEKALSIRPDVLLALGEAHPAPDGTARATAWTNARLRDGLDRSGYRRAVAAALALLQPGTLRKVVLARTVRAPLGPATAGRLFEAACAAHPRALVALVATERFGTWLGATPERLLVAQGGHLEVDSLAGTLSIGSAPRSAASWGAKEREEQAVVTEEIMHRLRHAGATGLSIHGPEVRTAGPLAHLHTRITGCLNTAAVLALAGELHPTPAVGGIPRTEAQRLIAALEPRKRSLYAGYWGPMDGGGARLFVNIRCMELSPTDALLHVGAGITAASDPDGECDEVELKARTWTDLIARVQRGG